MQPSVQLLHLFPIDIYVAKYTNALTRAKVCFIPCTKQSECVLTTDERKMIIFEFIAPVHNTWLRSATEPPSHHLALDVWWCFVISREKSDNCS